MSILRLVLWKRLGLGELLGERLNGSAAKAPWPAVAALIAVNRLVEPMPEWPMVRWWQRTALPQLLGIPLTIINDDRLYRCLDLALPHKQAIEERIAGVGQSLFGQSYRYLLYDLTSTDFEGQMESNPKALRGYSRDHRPDCKQVTIGAVVDREGYPVDRVVRDMRQVLVARAVEVFEEDTRLGIALRVPLFHPERNAFG